jgi:hypothetical protein
MEGLEGQANGLDAERDDSNLLVVIMRHVVPACPFVRAAKQIKTMIGRQSKMAFQLLGIVASDPSDRAELSERR